MIEIIVFAGLYCLYWGPPKLGNIHMDFSGYPVIESMRLHPAVYVRNSQKTRWAFLRRFLLESVISESLSIPENIPRVPTAPFLEKFPDVTKLWICFEV